VVTNHQNFATIHHGVELGYTPLCKQPVYSVARVVAAKLHKAEKRMEFVKRVSYCKLGRVPVTGAVLLCPRLVRFQSTPETPRAWSPASHLLRSGISNGP